MSVSHSEARMSDISVRDSAVLYAIGQSPMDRIHLMKALFLPWYRAGKSVPNYFSFEPYLYGPCSFDVYASLDRLLDLGLVAKVPGFNERWSKLRVTAVGSEVLKEVGGTIDAALAARIDKSVSEVSGLDLGGLLEKVYTEAPEFAVRSVYLPVLQRLKPSSALPVVAR